MPRLETKLKTTFFAAPSRHRSPTFLELLLSLQQTSGGFRTYSGHAYWRMNATAAQLWPWLALLQLEAKTIFLRPPATAAAYFRRQAAAQTRCPSLDRLVDDGLSFTPISADFSPAMQKLCAGTSPANETVRCVLSNREAAAAASALLFSAHPGSSLRPRVFWEVDQPARVVLPRGRPSEAMLGSLQANGYARVDDWGLDMDTLSSQAAAHLERANQRRVAKHRPAPLSVTSREPLPALAPLLSNRSLARIISTYLGGRARYDGHVILHLSPNASLKTYSSANWHHDRCGRRLKLWIYLHNVQADGKPTLVAAGTHNAMHFSLAAGKLGWLARFRDSYVRDRHSVAAMTGRQGGGFVFDTNALHGTDMSGPLGRTAIILEFHPHGKISRLIKERGAEPLGPCPSLTERGRPTWPLGVPGLPLYPNERDEGAAGRWRRLKHVSVKHRRRRASKARGGPLRDE